MARRKRSGDKERPVQVLLLITAILNLVRSLVDLFQRLTE